VKEYMLKQDYANNCWGDSISTEPHTPFS